MKPISLSGVITLVIAFFLTASTQAHSFGTTASAVWLTDCNQSNYFNTTGSGTGMVGPVPMYLRMQTWEHIQETPEALSCAVEK